MSATDPGNADLAASAQLAAEAEGTAEPVDELPSPASSRTPLIKARQMVAATAGLGLVTVWSALLGLITTPYLVRHLGASRYGVFGLITIISAYLTNLEFGFGHAMGRFLARARAARDAHAEDAVLNTSLAVFLAAAVVGVGTIALGAGVIDQHFVHGAQNVKHEAVGAIRLGAAVLFLAFLSTFAATGLGALGHFKTFVVTRAVFGTLLSAGAIGAVALGGGLRAVIAVQVGVGACQCFVLFTRLQRATPVRLRPAIDAQTFRAMGAFGIMVLVAGVAYQGILQGPPTVLAARSTTSEVAAFAVPALVMQQLVSIATSTSLGFLTFASSESTVADRTHLAAVFQSNLRMTLLVLGLPIAYIATFAHVLLASWIGSGFADSSATSLRYLAVAGLLLALSSAPADVARALGRPGWVTLQTVSAAVIAIGGSLLLVNRHGAGGVAAALSAAQLLTVLPFLLIVARRLLDTGLTVVVSRMARPLAAVACGATLFIVGNALTAGIAAAAVIGMLVTVPYGVVVLKFVADNRERNALRGVFQRGTQA
jgi:O-antigen/teichoic acid export membrane protein